MLEPDAWGSDGEVAVLRVGRVPVAIDPDDACSLRIVPPAWEPSKMYLITGENTQHLDAREVDKFAPNEPLPDYECDQRVNWWHRRRIACEIEADTKSDRDNDREGYELSGHSGLPPSRVGWRAPTGNSAIIPMLLARIYEGQAEG